MYVRSVMPEARVEVVEIDPVIVDVARRFFGFRTDSRMVVHTADGRALIEASPTGSYDLIVLDAFSDDAIPYSLTTRQFLEAVRSRLAPDGIVVSNVWSSHAGYPAMLATYRSVFPDVHRIRVPGRGQRIVLAGAGPRRLVRAALVAAARALAERVELGFDLADLVESGYEDRPAPPAPILQDAQEPALSPAGLGDP